MFPEYRELISKLKNSDEHFKRLFARHNELDHRIINIEARIENASDEILNALKREKLHIKDQLYVVLRRAAGQA
ncbi:MAG: YdcH family protein [Rhodocyclaceae bacterium]